MEDINPSTNLTCSHQEGGRKNGRPKLRYLDGALKDLQTLKIKAWWVGTQVSEYNTHKRL